MTPRRGLALILVGFVLLGVLYSLVTPIFEAPDESYHFFVIQHIGETGELPVQGAPGEALYEQEGSQPPLYYLSASLLTSWIDTSDARTFLRQNPQANLGDPANPGNKNHYIHTNREAFPYRGAPLAVHVLRIFSVGLGLIVVLFAYATARLVFPSEPAVAVFAAGLVAFTPQFIFISASVNNDNAINALAAIGLYLLARAWRGDRSLRSTLTLTIVVGLASLAKLGGLILVAYTCAVLAYLAWSRREWRWGVRSIAAVLIVAAMIGGWWYLRNAQLYGDVTGLSAMLGVVGQRAMGLSELIAELPGLWFSAWGVFGWFNLLLPDLVYLAYALLVLCAVLGGVWAFARMRRRGAQNAAMDESVRPNSAISSRVEPVLGLIGWCVLVAIGVLRWTATTLGSQGRLLFPAAAALAILFAAGLWHLLRGRFRSTATGSIVAAMLAVAAWVPVGVLQPAYAPPARVTSADVPVEATLLNLDFNGEIRLIGGLVGPRDAHPGDVVAVTLYWQALKKPVREYMVATVLLGRELEVVGKEDAFHGAGAYPSDLWQAGEVLRDRYEIRLADSARVPTRVRVSIRLRDRTMKEPVAVTTKDGALFTDLIVIDEFRLPPTETDRAPQVALNYRLGGAIELAGYDPPQFDASLNSIVYRLHWRALQTPDADYTVFAHLVESDGETIAAQWDSQPFEADYPTSWWRAGEAFVEERRLPLMDEVDLRGARIVVGLYLPPNGPRLPVYDVQGARLRDDGVVVAFRP